MRHCEFLAGIDSRRLGCSLCAAAVLALLAGCAPQRPVLYPNEKLNAVGAAAAQQDIDECIALAKQSGVGANKAGAVAGKTAGGAAIGAAGGAAAGAVRGHAGRGAAMGAAGGAATGLTAGLIKSRQLDPVTKRYVETCLHERGYKTLGWQ
jgi:outer membrane lipoprotein SlyB